MGYLRNKKAQWTLFLILLIVLPIVWHKGMGFYAGIKQKEAMSKPAEVYVSKLSSMDLLQLFLLLIQNLHF